MSNSKATKVISKEQTDHGYVIHKEYWSPVSFEVVLPEDDSGELDELIEALEAPSREPMLMTTAYTDNGDWIGDVKDAKFLCEEKGIKPEHPTPMQPFTLRPCCIGFCEAEQKWYGWSHRAIYGFGIGSHVKLGDLAYKPRDKEAFRRKYLEFFVGKDRDYINPQVRDSVNADGERGALITATYGDTTPNERLRGTEYVLFWPYRNEKFGLGEWFAETLKDARQMAIDFADGVS